MARTFGSNHHDVEIGARVNLVVVDVEAVSEGQRRAFFQVGLDVAVVGARHQFIGDQDHHEVGCFDCIGDFLDVEASLLGLVPRCAAFTQTDADLDARVLQVVGVGVTLRAVADDRDLALLDEGEVCVLVVKNFHDEFPGKK